MKIKIEYIIKAILSGVDETVVNNLEFGNSYSINKDSLINRTLCEEFDYTIFGIRRIYELSKLNKELEIALLTKKAEVNYEISESIIDSVSVTDFEQIYEHISDIEDKELSYIDQTMKYIRLFSENCFNIKEVFIKCKVINLDDNSTIFSDINSKIPLPDKILGDIPKLHIENESEANKLNDFIKNINTKISSSNFLSKTLSQVCFLYDQSYTSPIETLRFIVCVIGLESILVDGKAELVYRFSRNGAMLLSNTAEEYWEFSKILKDIYNKRSTYVHTGNVKDLKSDDVTQAREILRKVIFKILSKNLSKKELLKELELKGY